MLPKTTLSAFVALLILPVSFKVYAQSELADMWLLTVKPSMRAPFEIVLKDHMAYRKQQGEKRNWKVYTNMIGGDLDVYVVRFCCTTWQQIDDYNKWRMESDVGAHWIANIQSMVTKMEHVFSIYDRKNSRTPQDVDGLKYFGVTRFYSKMGREMDIETTKFYLSSKAKEGDWPLNWSWFAAIGGAPMISLVSGFKNFAEMASPEEMFSEFLAKQLGSKSEARIALSKFSENFSHQTYEIYELRSDLSVMPITEKQ